jgi:hypothetical protein
MSHSARQEFPPPQSLPEWSYPQFMMSLLPSAHITFLHTPRIWYISPHRNKGSSPQNRHRKYPPKMAISMDDMTETEPVSPVPTGVHHWEEQRKQWTRGFEEQGAVKRDDVHGLHNMFSLTLRMLSFCTFRLQRMIDFFGITRNSQIQKTPFDEVYGCPN